MRDGAGPARVVGGHDVGASAEGAHRQAAADDLAEAGQVGTDAVHLLQAARGEPEGDHLVEDEQDAALGGDLAQSLEEGRGRRAARPVPVIGSTMTAASSWRWARMSDGGAIEVVEDADDHLADGARRQAGRHGVERRRDAHRHLVVGTVIAAGHLEDLRPAR